MGLTGRLFWVSSYSKKQWRKLFWKVRAAVKKTGEGRRWRKGGSKQHLKFQYDPSSYALNFDDGSNSKRIWEETANLTNEENVLQHLNFQLIHSNPTAIVTTTSSSSSSSSSNTIWIYVFWVKI